MKKEKKANLRKNILLDTKIGLIPYEVKTRIVADIYKFNGGSENEF